MCPRAGFYELLAIHELDGTPTASKLAPPAAFSPQHTPKREISRYREAKHTDNANRTHE